ncbi:hypothetical protein RB623_22905 [Mesorhizobium sp. LHD-90]|uniref:hypothetical protein n=1 Tax=Mesorhizobium sp. LHD-90 TaxID=3071414 RepID=UPI0027E04863|nr:hypothetical protein [Mesorhizobium sp. LHD-90]MDQ6436910.1 hypothetical protein [Mesorhizobium sp. LHD-90]
MHDRAGSGTHSVFMERMVVLTLQSTLRDAGRIIDAVHGSANPNRWWNTTGDWKKSPEPAGQIT